MYIYTYIYTYLNYLCENCIESIIRPFITTLHFKTPINPINTIKRLFKIYKN